MRTLHAHLFYMARNTSPSPIDDPGSRKRKVPVDANGSPISLPVKRTRAEIQEEKEKTLECRPSTLQYSEESVWSCLAKASEVDTQSLYRGIDPFIHECAFAFVSFCSGHSAPLHLVMRV